MSVTKFISVVAVALTISVVAAAQAPKSDGGVTVRHVPITKTPSESGKAMFDSYCAVCHGKGAKGDGPAASAMKTPPSDLTVLAQKNAGKYPASHVAAVIRGQAETPSHGSKDMPVWGPLFSSISQGHEGQVQQRITNLVGFVETLQSK